MIISQNANAQTLAFEQLLEVTNNNMMKAAANKKAYFLGREGTKLESDLFNCLKETAKGTIFQDSIELCSGRNFPDIVAKKYFGVEVKTSTKAYAPWKSMGNSVLESSRVDSVERIYMYFGKLLDPIEFRYRKYEECLSNVCVTHSPRYQVDFETPKGKTIFDEMRTTYDELRKQDNPIKTVMKHFRANLKEGEDLWYLDTGEPTTDASDVKIRFWRTLTDSEKEELKLKMLALFPEITNAGPAGSMKYERAAAWLVTKMGIVAPSFRDIFSGGAQLPLVIGKRTYLDVPRSLHRLQGKLDRILQYVDGFSDEEIEHYWRIKCTRDQRSGHWLKMFSTHASDALNASKLDIKTFIKSELKE